MNTFDTICSRKSIRSYTGEQPTDEQLAKILTAAQAAPVGMKAYGDMALTVITNPDLLERINKATGASMNMPDFDMLYGAPVLIVVSSKVAPAPNDITAHSNCAIVAHNMVLEAVELGLGACYLWAPVFAIDADPELLAELNLPEGVVPCAAIGLGATELSYELREIPQDRIAVTHI